VDSANDAFETLSGEGWENYEAEASQGFSPGKRKVDGLSGSRETLDLHPRVEEDFGTRHDKSQPAH
jgi:hypothetical protein